VHALSLAISSIEMYECFSRHCKLRERARGDGMTLSRCQISQRKRRQPRHESKPPRGCLHLGPIGGLAEWTFTPSIPQSSPPSPISFGHSGGRASWRSKLLSHPSPIDALRAHLRAQTRWTALHPICRVVGSSNRRLRMRTGDRSGPGTSVECPCARDIGITVVNDACAKSSKSSDHFESSKPQG
jgi:hypothetical protein